jgi:hypothetical protein
MTDYCWVVFKDDMLPMRVFTKYDNAETYCTLMNLRIEGYPYSIEKKVLY